MRGSYKRIALSISLMLVVIWGILGTGTSLAWFTDTDEEVKNVFHFAEFDLEVSHRLEDGSWETIQQDTKIFNDEALYEPGFVQIAYLKVENKGTVPFLFQTSVVVSNYTRGTNIFGQQFNLQDHLRFGLVTEESEAELYETVATRNLAKECANMPLNNYDTNAAVLEAGGTIYMALIVRMPEEVGNVANYRGNTIPTVELGLIVNATQLKD